MIKSDQDVDVVLFQTFTLPRYELLEKQEGDNKK